MNDNTKVLDQNPVSGSLVQPSAPVGVANKEVGRVTSPVSEFVTLSGTETVPNIPPEVSAHIEVKQDSPPLTEEHKQIGVVDAGPHAPVPTSSSGNVILPMSEKEIEDRLKGGQNDDSGRGLAKLLKKVTKWWGFKKQ